MANIFSSMVLSKISNKMSDEFLKSVVGDALLKKEVNRALQQANRRAQNIERAGLPSPALKALYAERGIYANKYTKFSIAGLDVTNPIDWEMIKSEYGRALAFMNNPTSLATGTRQYIKSVAADYTAGHFDAAVKLVDVATNPQISSNGKINAFNYGDVLEVFANDVMETAKEIDFNKDGYMEQLEQMLNDALERASENDIATQFLKMFGNGSPRMF